jgi:ribosomal protein L24E
MKRLASDGSLDMSRLAEMERADLVAVLDALADDYAAWIGELRERTKIDVQGYASSATAAIDRCESILERLREGIEVLKSDDAALEAFRFANRSMASQRVHSVYSLRVRRGETVDLASGVIPEMRSCRPFQLAFILLSVPALANPVHRDRTEPVEAFADLLWFPTGGGKTEAYLGVAAFTMAIRRLQGNIGGLDGGRGLAVIMRYTLRLLTIQQFQRATTLMCAMEVLRRADTAKWGATPFTIGLWVGQRVTPNTTEESHEAIERERDGKYGTGSTPAQFTFCPWCGSEIAPGRDVKVVRDIGRTFIFCGDKYGTCEFGKVKSPDLGLPALVVDEELYRHPPSMLIATVDKFATMAWRGQVRTLFGRADTECPRTRASVARSRLQRTHRKKGSLPATTPRPTLPIRPPDLIIQDEFHLIGGPLGTMVGLYETAVDELCSWTFEGKKGPTENRRVDRDRSEGRRTGHNVFLRRVAVFLLMVSTWRTISFPSSDRSIGTPDAGTWHLFAGSSQSRRPHPGIRGLAHGRSIPVRAIRAGGRSVHDPGGLFQFATRTGRNASARGRRRPDPFLSCPDERRVSTGAEPALHSKRRRTHLSSFEQGDTEKARPIGGQVQGGLGQRRNSRHRHRPRHEHAIRRGGRKSARADGRQRAAQKHGGIHPGHQPCRPCLSGAGLHGTDVVPSA